jgi:hypothetical protein
MKDRVSAWLLLVLLVGLPTLAYAGEADHVFAGVGKTIELVFKLVKAIFMLIVAIGLIYMIFNKKT